MMVEPIMEAASRAGPLPPVLPLAGEATALLAALDGIRSRTDTLEGHPR
jgi:hypothetical protein